MDPQVAKIRETETYKRLVDAIAGGALAMVGAGSSAQVGYPSWPELLKQLSQIAIKKNPECRIKLEAFMNHSGVDDDLVWASEIKQELGEDQFLSEITKIFSPRVPPFNEFHKQIIKLPFDHILTTNYESVLETAQTAQSQNSDWNSFDFDEEEKRGHWLTRLRDKNLQRSIIHLHGSIQRPEGIILTQKDFDICYIQRQELAIAIGVAFTLFPVVFIGFSTKDADFMGPIRKFATFFGSDIGETRHFAILESHGQEHDVALRVSLQKRYRIEPLFYDSQNNHSVLEPFMKALNDDVLKKKQDNIKQDFIQIESFEKSQASGQYSSSNSIHEVADITRRICANLIPITETTSGVVAESDTTERVLLDDEIDKIFQHVRNGEPGVAVAMYDQILHREGIELSSRLKYRLYANKGNALYAQNYKKDAAKQYLIAYKLWPKSKHARALNALGHLLLGLDKQAYKLANELCQDEPDFARAHCIRLQTLPEGFTFKDARKSLTPNLRKNAEVANALSGLAAEQGFNCWSELYSRFAVRAEPDWIEAGISLAGCLLTKELSNASIDVDNGLVPQNKSRVVEAESILTRILDQILKSGSCNYTGTTYYNRATARRLLRDCDGARNDIEAAYHNEPTTPDIVVAYAAQKENDGDQNGAIRILRKYPGYIDKVEICIPLAIYLYERKEKGDWEHAEEILEKCISQLISIDSQSKRSEMLLLYINLLVDQGKDCDALTLLDKINWSLIVSGMRELFTAQIKYGQKKVVDDEIRNLVHEAEKLLPLKTEYFIRRDVAVFAARINEHSLALKIWKQLITPIRINSDTIRMLHSAYLAEDDSYILKFCESLRNNGYHDKQAYMLEFETLVRCRELSKAIGLAVDWLKHDPDDRFMRLNLSLIALQNGAPEYVESDYSKLPKLDDVENPQQGANIVFALRHTTTPGCAAEFAYQLWRRFPDDPITSRILIGVVFQPVNDRTVLAKPEQVNEKSAVVYKEENTGQVHNIVVENGPKPSHSFDEYSQDESTVKSIWAHYVGDIVNLNGKRIKIIAIENKIVWRAHRCFEMSDKYFPDDKFIQKFDGPGNIDESTSPKEALGGAWEFLNEKEQHTKRLQGLYQTQELPVSMFARQMGRSVLETISYLAGSGDLVIKVCQGTQEEWVRSYGYLANGCEVVLDSTAIATLFMLGLSENLDELPFKIIIPESAIHAILRVLEQHISSGQEKMYLGILDGQPVIHEVSPQEEARWVQNLERLVISLREHCEIVGGSAILDLSPDQRKELPELLGTDIVDAMAIAKQRQCVYWTDDSALASLALTEWNLKRVWSQLALRHIINNTKVLHQLNNKISASLLLWGYEFTQITHQTAVHLYQEAKWEMDDYRILKLEEYLVRFGAANERNLYICANIIVAIWYECPIEQTARQLIYRLLDKIGRDISGPYIARRIYRYPFPAEMIPKCRRLRRMLRQWRSRIPSPNKPLAPK